MTIRTTAAPQGTPCWIDLGTSDPARSIEFYSAMFGWKATDQGEAFGHYHLLTKDDRPVAGLMAVPEDNPYPDGWSVYLAADDAAATQAAVVANGGAIVSEAMGVGPLGTMVIAADPAGSVFGVWQAAAHVGFEEFGTENTPVWFENYSRDYAAARDFYARVFGVGYSMLADSDEFRYAQIEVDGEVVGGLMDSARSLPEGEPSHWQMYVGVEDCDAAVARAVELGATVAQEPFDSPYGRLSLLVDPTGAQVLVIKTAGE